MGLRGSEPFRSVGEHLDPKFKLFHDLALDEKSAVDEVTVLGLAHDGVTRAAIQGPLAGVLFYPEGQLVPNLSDAEPLGEIAGGNLKHGEAAHLGAMLGLGNPGQFYAQLRVGEAKSVCSRTGRREGRIVRWENAAERQDGVQLHSRNGAPIELKRRPEGVVFDGSAVHAAENIGFVVLVIDRRRVVGLVRRSLRTGPIAAE